MTVYAQQYWQHRLGADRAQLQRRRQEGLYQATAAAKAMRQTWPGIRAVHLFGSILGEGFRDHSDLDLLVEGLPASALLDALALAEAAGPLPVDLKRHEDLSDDLVKRLLRRSRPL
jgi:predicted nucleotidyltransferase